MSEEVARAAGDIAYWRNRAEQAEALALTLQAQRDQAEADAAELRELYTDIERWRESGGDVRELRYVLDTADRIRPNAGAALLTELEAARKLIELQRSFYEAGGEVTGSFPDYLAAYDAAWKARSE